MIYHGDLFDVLPTIEAHSIDACVTDPPYGIGFMGREWDTFKPGSGKHRRLMHPRERESRGKIVSDNPNLNGRTRSPALSPSQIEYDYSVAGLRAFQDWTQQWALEVFRVLKPGAYLLACGAPRSFHRMACGVEDAGFEIRDCLSWLCGQGFPKSLNVAKAIQAMKARGGSRPEDIRVEAMAETYQPSGRGRTNYDHGSGSVMNGEDGAITDSEAQLWIGWGTALKPGWEPIIVARKPFKRSVASNVLTHGTGALNIAACRLAGDTESRERADCGGFELSQGGDGRWPANVLLDEDAAAMLDQQTGDLSNGGMHRREYDSTYGEGGPWPSNETRFAGDVGGASRFYYVAKPSRKERDYGCDLIAARQRDESRKEGNPGGDNPRNRGVQLRGNFHPTVKPVELMRWLVRLVTPQTGVVLDPFTGSGTTGMACRYEQRRFIGIEREADYVEIANARIAAAAPLFGEVGA